MMFIHSEAKLGPPDSLVKFAVLVVY